MSIEFRCRSCNRLLRTEDGTSGQTARCPDCGSLTVIPAPAATFPPPPQGTAGEAFGASPSTAGGTNPYQTPTQYDTSSYGVKPPNDGRATASLVLGIVGLILWCCPLVGMAACVVGLTLGLLSVHSQSRSVAIAGIALNSIGLLLSLANAVIGALIALAG
jgi:phage FluMu protein Com